MKFRTKRRVDANDADVSTLHIENAKENEIISFQSAGSILGLRVE